jgi:K+-transporting ATPase KdpF subunit
MTMADLVYIGVVVLFFALQRAVCPLLRETLNRRFMENLIVGVVALLLFAYLFVAMIRPEKF